MIFLPSASANEQDTQLSCEQLTPAGAEQCIALSEWVCTWENTSCVAAYQWWNVEKQKTGSVREAILPRDSSQIDFGNLLENNINNIPDSTSFSHNAIIPFASTSQKNNKTKNSSNKIFTNVFSCDNVTDVSTGATGECNALVAFYNSTNGANWDSGTNRLGHNDATPTTVCDWYGVTCTGNHVQQLYFYSNNLSWTLPSGIGNLNHLKNLYLYYENISSLWTGFANLTNLEKLAVYGSTLPSIPTGIGNLTHLIELNLWYNEFTWSRAELRTLTWLKTLSLYDNGLSSIPAGINNLTNLTDLNLWYNQLTWSLANLRTLTWLKILSLYSNRLSYLPTGIENLANLTGLNLWYNLLTWSLPQLRTLTWLESLSLYGNRLSSISTWIANLTNLVELNLWYNYLTSLPEELRTLTELENLYVYENELSSLSTWIENLVNLVELDASYNYLTWLPGGLWTITWLQTISLSDNRLSSISTWIGNLTNLVELSLWYNRLTSLPTEIGSLSSLENFDLSDNRLTSLPASFINLTTLKDLDISYNALTWLHTSFGNLIGLEDLNISDNALTSLPNSFVNLTTLKDLDISYNELTWLPASFTNLTNLESLNLYSNELSGALWSIGTFTKLTYLNLGNNNIDSLPDELFDLTNLETLYLNWNNLTWISTDISHLTNLYSLSLSYNDITSLPDELFDLTNLEYLYIDSNLLTTLSESVVSQLSGLEYMPVSYNCFDTSLMSTGLIAFMDDRSMNSSWQSHRNPYCAYEDNAVERNSLIALYNATDGANWNNTEYWLTTWVSICSRAGVSCEYDWIRWHIVGLDLWSQNIFWTIPSEIGNLSGLQSLYLDDNRLTSLPAQIGNLIHLSTIDLSSNDFTSLPTWLWNLSHLQNLYLNNNLLTWSLTGFCSLTGLNSFSISHNRFAGDIPVCITGLDNVESWSMDYNYLTTTISDGNLVTYLNNHFYGGAGWNTQYSIADLSLSWVISSLGSDFFVLTLWYTNHWPKTINSGMIYYDMMDNMSIVASHEYRTWEIEKTYWGFGDPCFDELYATTWIYLDMINTSIQDIYWFFGVADLYEFIQLLLGYNWDASGAWKFFIDYFIENYDWEMDWQSLFGELGVDMSSAPNCWTWGKNVYIFDLGTLDVWSNGNIVITWAFSTGLAASGFTNNLNIFSSDELRQDSMRLNNAFSFIYNSWSTQVENNTSLFTDVSEGTIVVTDSIDLGNTWTITTPNHDINVRWDNIEALLPADTTITQTGLFCDVHELLAPQDMSDQFPGTIKAFKIWSSCTWTTLTFSNLVKIRIYVDTILDTTFNVLISRDGINWESVPAVRISDHILEITTSHFSYFKISETTTNNIPSGWGGWSYAKDVCPAQRDCSDSYYDKVCGPCSFVNGTGQTTWLLSLLKNKPAASIANSSYSTELNNSYLRAYGYNITTMPTIQEANIEGTLLRRDMAKMISNFAINVMNKNISTWVKCEFTDTASLSKEMQYYAIAACRLWLMWYESDGVTVKQTFNPDQEVDRGQFGTILSRLIRWTENNGGTTYYQKHLDALKTEGIMTKIETPSQKELRGRVMLMLMRAAE